MNGQAARQQADGVEDRRLEHLARSWSSEALPYIEKISNHKNREDRRLGNNEADHCDFAAIGQPPGCRRLRERICDCTHCFLPLLIATVFHSYRLSGSSGCFRSHNGRRLATTGMEEKLYVGGGELVAHSSVQASQGSLPAFFPLK